MRRAILAVFGILLLALLLAPPRAQAEPSRFPLGYPYDLTDDDRLQQALSDLSDLPGIFDRIVMARDNGTLLFWGHLPDGVLGRYHPYARAILISDRLYRAPLSELGPVLGHELWHAAYHDTYDDSARDCLQEEMDAYLEQAAVWSSWRRYPRTPIERTHEAALTAFLDGDLAAFVVRQPGYQIECLGGQLQNH